MKGIYLICVLSIMFIVGCSASQSVKPPTTRLEGSEAITESPQKAALYLLDMLSIPVKMKEITRQVFKEEISNDPRLSSYGKELHHVISMPHYRVLIENYIEKYLSYNSVKEELASIYASHFTESELMQHAEFFYTFEITPDMSLLEFTEKRNQLAEFSSSPLGRKVQKIMPEFEMQMTQLAESRTKDSLGELVTMLDEESKSLPSGLED